MEIKIALAGNPNCGKTTLFNALTGSNQFVGNWPGVTVEKKEGRLKGEKDVIITDLPGIYSLSPYTMEEVVARNVLIDQRPDALLNIIDATNLERNLYLTTQLAELGIPMVVALNMMDVVRRNGDRIDAAKLSNHLGVPVVEISALKGDGVMEAAQRAVQLARSGKKTIPQHRFAGSIEHALAHIEEVVLHDMPEERQRWFAVKIFERDERIIEKLNIPKDKLAHIENDIKACETEMDDDSQSIITAARYTYIASIIDGCVKKSNRGMSTSDKIDRVLTNRILGLPIFAAVMTLVYYIAISTVGGALTDWTNDVFVGEWIVPAAQSFFEGIGCADWLTGLIVDGVISGVGAVLGFVPQMLVLFLLLCILEDCGYMARIAFIMDRVFRRFGLSGKSFIPMLVGTGCGVPGIMASRTIEQERDRRMTIMTTTFIPCGAKMPIVALMAGAIFGGAWWVAPSAYFIGIAAIVISGIILKKTKPFAGEPAPFVMELPAYHLPTVKNVLRGTWVQKGFMTLTLITVFMGSMLAYREPLIKKRLAYSTVSQVSYVLFGLACMVPTAFEGAMLHVVAHSVIKDALFLCAGAFIHQTGKTYVRDLRGIGKEMPITTWCWTIASLGLIGIPPTGGFVSKWELATGSLQTGLAGFDVIGPVILIVSALLTAAYLLPVTINGFFPGSDYDYSGLTNKEGGKLMTVPMILLAIGVVVTGVFAQPLINAIAVAAASVL